MRRFARRPSRFSYPGAPAFSGLLSGKTNTQKVRFLGDFLVDWFRKRPIPQ